MLKKRYMTLLAVVMLFITGCLGACVDKGTVEVYLDWGTYRQTVNIAYGATVNDKTVPYIAFDFVKSLYLDADFTQQYKNQRIKQSTVLYVNTDTKYPLEKSYCYATVDDNFVNNTDVLISMNKGFKFDVDLQDAIRKAGVDIVSFVNGEYDDALEQKFGDDFYRSSKLMLSTTSKNELLEAIRIIEKFSQIKNAGPNIFMEPALEPNDSYYE